MKRISTCWVVVAVALMGWRGEAFSESGADEARGRSRVEGYVRGGAAFYDLQLGTVSSYAYGIGALWRPYSWLDVDLGYQDFGRVASKSWPIYVIDPVRNFGSGGWWDAREFHLMPRLRWNFGRFSVYGGLGVAMVETHQRSYNYFVMNPSVAQVTQTSSKWRWIGGAGIEWRMSERITLGLCGFQTMIAGYDWDPHVTPYAAGLKYERPIRSLMLSLSWHGGEGGAGGRVSPFRIEAGPAFSRVSFFENIIDNAMGYDFAIRYELGRSFFARAGHMETGEAKGFPRKPDGSELDTPPMGVDAVGFHVKTGITYALIGWQTEIGERVFAEVGAGAGYARGNFYHGFAVPWHGFSVEVGRPAMLAEGGLVYQISKDWYMKLAARYSQYEGVPLTLPEFEPTFGNTTVRVWSFMPTVGLRF